MFPLAQEGTGPLPKCLLQACGGSPSLEGRGTFQKPQPSETPEGHSGCQRGVRSTVSLGEISESSLLNQTP